MRGLAGRTAIVTGGSTSITSLAAIREREDGPFDAAWMRETFETYWSHARLVVGWTSAHLTSLAVP